LLVRFEVNFHSLKSIERHTMDQFNLIPPHESIHHSSNHHFGDVTKTEKILFMCRSALQYYILHFNLPVIHSFSLLSQLHAFSFSFFSHSPLYIYMVATISSSLCPRRCYFSMFQTIFPSKLKKIH
jgi:hypothetical protein